MELPIFKEKFIEKTGLQYNVSNEEYKTKDFVFNKIINIIKEEQIPSIMSFPNKYGNLYETPKFNNILYYDEFDFY